MAEHPTTTFTLEPLGPFSLEAAARFWGDFTPSGHTGLDPEGHMHMAFPSDGTWSPIGICLRRSGSGVTADIYSEAEPETSVIRRQTARILSLDVDGRGLADIAKRDAVAARLLERFPGLRPVCFYSPYEA